MELNTIVVDNSPELKQRLVTILSGMEGIQVRESFDDAVAAMQYIEENQVDLVFSDVVMPEISGTEMMQYLHRNAESASHSTPIVVLTANAIAGAREDYIRKGFDDFMTKPIDVDVLQKILMKYLK